MKLQGIAIREKKRAAMHELNAAEVTVAKGVASDFRGKPSKRQVTLLSSEQWQQACNAVNKQLPWTVRRANLLVSGVEFSQADVGKLICIGDVRLRVQCETDPCSRMDEQHQGLYAALLPKWRGGICCEVLQSGQIAIGDEVIIDSDQLL